ncbi:Target of EGR1, member 1 (Nuclear) [Phlyctochytrium planicorne]|nr:Target of EGR1, member 1 (Nuclear) [Phlyctochytrium planicorne]
MFLYQALHASLPTFLDVFVADLADMFQGGIYDTKYVADFVTREGASFLAYVFRKYEREQLKQKQENQSHFTIEIRDRLHSVEDGQLKYATLTFRQEVRMIRKGELKRKAGKETNKPYCMQYASHGFCDSGRLCEKSHDLDLILDCEASANGQRKKKKAKTVGDDSTLQPKSVDADAMQNHSPSSGEFKPTTPFVSQAPVVQTAAVDKTPVVEKSSVFETYHSACFDAYMTGYVFCQQLLKYPKLLSEHKNKIYLIGKERPLLIQQSSFAKMSDGHLKRKRMAESMSV